MNLLFCGYRGWALSVAKDLIETFTEDDFFIAQTRKQFDEYSKTNIEFNLVLFVGWSWLIGEKFLAKNKCVCIHPSPLPKYRGGSPIQHQIMAGEKTSKVTAFLMTEGLDDGPILAVSDEFNLHGALSDVLGRIATHSLECLSEVISLESGGSLVGKPQKEEEATLFKRRKKCQSEITIGDFRSYTARVIYDKIRALQDPYPNAYVVCGDGKKLYFTGAKIDD
jgi:methionyl-tRNA formyltransferase